MVLRLYNSLGRQLETFVPIREGEVRMYTCGPTVWNFAHIGNLRTFVSEDVLRRYLIFKGYRVTQVKNITDVEDKIIEGMKRTGKSLRELTDFYTSEFMKDIQTLNVQRVEFYPRATQHIPEMESMIKSLLRSGHAYLAEDGSTYFSIRSFEHYGELSGVKIEGLKEGARVSADSYEKLGAHDFALWKAWDAADGEVFWESELGKGRPGWHIECSAMAIKYLGESFDIHTGGKDLKFPHHENEIAQSEAVTGKRFAKYWLHMEFLRINGEEMHKSLGNTITLRQLLEKGWKPRVIRLFLIGAHYRDEMNLTDESLLQAKTNIARMDAFRQRLGDYVATAARGEGVAESAAFLSDFESAMDDDLNVARALAALYGFHRVVNSLIDAGTLSKSGKEAVLGALGRADSVLGVMQPETTAPLSAHVEALIRERDEARRRRDYGRADEIRAQLKSEGIIIEDKPGGGTTWKAE